ncbi:hypothetical protein P7K49_009223 [Saguinus oedipus]|uniref:Uncharacterized protein n=1 Tax=Saguinus oedipus TaxID=9490 RepID=A0ABQ9VMF8_SAGOE|nr:hypothetical protein P7K49_009223 [Saguinus oedipus]
MASYIGWEPGIPAFPGPLTPGYLPSPAALSILRRQVTRTGGLEALTLKRQSSMFSEPGSSSGHSLPGPQLPAAQTGAMQSCCMSSASHPPQCPSTSRVTFHLPSDLPPPVPFHPPQCPSTSPVPFHTPQCPSTSSALPPTPVPFHLPSALPPILMPFHPP